MAKGVNPEENGVMVASSTNGGIASQRQPIALRTPAPELPLQLPDEQQASKRLPKPRPPVTHSYPIRSLASVYGASDCWKQVIYGSVLELIMK
uniref:Uncharacterized protein n=1 Tax=Oryza rufipogon TaxID=4529 RepID=A0A0E0NXF2_ORYRU